MAEHQLDGAEIGAALEQMRRERMPDDVRAQRAANAGAASVRLENLPEADARQRSAASVQEQPWRRRGARTLLRRDQLTTALALIPAHPAGRHFADRNDPFFAPL